MSSRVEATHEAVLQAGDHYKRAARQLGESLLSFASNRMAYERPEDLSDHVEALNRLGTELDAAITAAYDAGEEGRDRMSDQPSDTEDYAAWVERLEPTARRAVDRMNERITELVDKLTTERARSERLAKALEAFVNIGGHSEDGGRTWHTRIDERVIEQAHRALSGGASTPASATAPEGQALPDMASTNFGLLACCRNWAGAPEMGPYVGAHHPRCPKLWAAVAPFSAPPAPATAPEPHPFDRACRNTRDHRCICMHLINGQWCGRSSHDPIHRVTTPPVAATRSDDRPRCTYEQGDEALLRCPACAPATSPDAARSDG